LLFCNFRNSGWEVHNSIHFILYQNKEAIMLHFRFLNALMVVFLSLALLMPVQSVRAASTITVNSTADTAVHDGLCTLREAITNANGDLDYFGGDCAAGSGADTIIFASSLGPLPITLNSALPILSDGDGITIDGDNRITISGNNSVRVLHNSAGALTLQNITITHGSASNGAGLYNTSTETVTIIHSVFSNNSATGTGGGVLNGGGTMNVLNTTFSENHSDTDGGGMHNGGGPLTIANSTFSNNSANYGGGMENNSGTATIYNSTFSGNTASIRGGALSTYDGGPNPSIVAIYNSILANSSASEDCFNWVSDGTLNGNNNIIETTAIGAFSCSSITASTADPMLDSLAGSPAYFPLKTGSPAINAGNDAICSAAPVSNRDQRGVTRPGGLHCDIGAFEKNYPIFLPLLLR
jgi:CSLREA domain-containing protein